jgi:hypothetical protein
MGGGGGGGRSGGYQKAVRMRRPVLLTETKTYPTGRKLSPRQSYLGEKRERKTKDGEENEGIQGRIGFFPYALSLGNIPLSPLISVGGLTQVCICNGYRKSTRA